MGCAQTAFDFIRVKEMTSPLLELRFLNAALPERYAFMPLAKMAVGSHARGLPPEELGRESSRSIPEHRAEHGNVPGRVQEYENGLLEGSRGCENDKEGSHIPGIVREECGDGNAMFAQKRARCARMQESASRLACTTAVAR